MNLIDKIEQTTRTLQFNVRRLTVKEKKQWYKKTHLIVNDIRIRCFHRTKFLVKDLLNPDYQDMKIVKLKDGEEMSILRTSDFWGMLREIEELKKRLKEYEGL